MRPITLLFAVVTFVHAPSLARACSDAGPRNYCNDGGAAWLRCGSHEDCPAGQVCGVTAHCECGDSCAEQWTPQGVRCAAPSGALEAGVAAGCWVTEVGCNYLVSCLDAGPVDAGSTFDGGAGAPGPAPACSYRAGGGGADALGALAIAIALLALGRRSRR